MSVLCDSELREYATVGEALVRPWRDDAVQPSSVDLRLGTSFRVFTSHEIAHVDLRNVPANFGTGVVVTDSGPFILHPGEFILGSTLERVVVPVELACRIEGKSSVGRLGLIVHATAGYVDPGFEGELTLEMTNLLRVPILLWPGQDICQVSFTRMSREPDKPYSGRYQGDTGAVASRYGQDGPIHRDKQCPIVFLPGPGKSVDCEFLKGHGGRHSWDRGDGRLKEYAGPDTYAGSDSYGGTD